MVCAFHPLWALSMTRTLNIANTWAAAPRRNYLQHSRIAREFATIQDIVVYVANTTTRRTILIGKNEYNSLSM